VHREVCGAAALYFPRFSPEELAHRILLVAESADCRQQLSQFARIRSSDFSWAKHIDELLRLADTLAHERTTSFEPRNLGREPRRDVQAASELG
jgi:hypothetical protein